MAPPGLHTDPLTTPMISSDCTCCDYCAYCGGGEWQGEINAVLHRPTCPWMELRIAAGLPLNESCYNHRYIDDPEIVVILERLRARR